MKFRKVFLFILGIIFLGIIFLGLRSSIGGTFLSRLSVALNSMADKEFYLALANSQVTYVSFAEGMRKEQMAGIMKKKLAWDNHDVEEFLDTDTSTPLSEGRYFPDSYVVPKKVSGELMRKLMFERFKENISPELEEELSQSNLNMETVLTIASIIQREAAGKSDMNLISGIIWNRLFAGMKLDIDATLQYAKGNSSIGWWPKVIPKDKFIVSDYNTYKLKGLPPSPIANPGLAAIEAAFNPEKTECLYYFHKNKKIYCSKTYKEHVNNINKYLK